MPDSKDFTVKFSAKLKEAMASRKITAHQLSIATGISDSNISRYLKGTYAPKRNNIYLIARALQVNPLWLLCFSKDMDIPDYQSDQNRAVLKQLVDDMDGEQVAKTLSFVEEYIIK